MKIRTYTLQVVILKTDQNLVNNKTKYLCIEIYHNFLCRLSIYIYNRCSLVTAFLLLCSSFRVFVLYCCWETLCGFTLLIFICICSVQFQYIIFIRLFYGKLFGKAKFGFTFIIKMSKAFIYVDLKLLYILQCLHLNFCVLCTYGG